MIPKLRGELLIKILRSRGILLVLTASISLLLGILFLIAQQSELAGLAFMAGTVPVLLALIVQIVRSLRKGDAGLDIVAALSMAVALSFNEHLAANVVALMYAGGQLLESFASSRAAREMTALMGRVAHTTMRYAGDALEEVPIIEVLAGDRLMIRRGEVLPVDGVILSGEATLDESALTGEAVPHHHFVDQEVLSGTTSVGDVFDLVALRPAAESTYAAVVRLVEAAQKTKAPMVRLADRYAILFLAVTLSVAFAAWWLSGDPRRALAVLVIATPCPLILAVPVAIMSGISRCAAQGCLVKDGGTLEALGRVRVAILDKTGTLTHGKAAVSAIETAGWLEENELLRLAASLDQASGHVFAYTLIEAAHDRGLHLEPPTNVDEAPGDGIEGSIGRHRVIVGGDPFVAGRVKEIADPPVPNRRRAGEATISVAVDGRIAGSIVLSDRVRPEALNVLKKLRRYGVNRIILASGDRLDVAIRIGKGLGLDEILGEQTPASKVAVVASARQWGPVLMVGDGVNDAPALAMADVGVALGARGAAAASQSAGVVLLVDRLEPLAEALGIAQRTIHIARQSVFAGLGLSLAGMIAAAFGYLQPLHGALLQEVIDVAVILNALRALRPRREADSGE
ncbi:heavy metal translocating P-type ATPase [Rhizobium sp. Root1204]|uniref:heavy metal translocating P-type ATPase n=1 Tax=Rhizobium sp. Root1204 TaxID=1736428 RepID=UPI0007134ECA|nr:heavy metal translocating P-type ATPase [Rhizobium sp. Root1204]KQV36677.1 haloacid dehalogenase [Rhizobium sp. Root1204]